MWVQSRKTNNMQVWVFVTSSGGRKLFFFLNWTSLLKQFPQHVKPAGKALMEPLDLAQHNLSGI